MSCLAKTAIVTGASQGIGAGIVKAFVERVTDGSAFDGQGHHDAVMYLTDAATVTGHILYVDGGSHFGRW